MTLKEWIDNGGDPVFGFWVWSIFEKGCTLRYHFRTKENAEKWKERVVQMGALSLSNNSRFGISVWTKEDHFLITANTTLYPNTPSWCVVSWGETPPDIWYDKLPFDYPFFHTDAPPRLYRSAVRPKWVTNDFNMEQVT